MSQPVGPVRLTARMHKTRRTLMAKATKAGRICSSYDISHARSKCSICLGSIWCCKHAKYQHLVTEREIRRLVHVDGCTGECGYAAGEVS